MLFFKFLVEEKCQPITHSEISSHSQNIPSSCIIMKSSILPEQKILQQALNLQLQKQFAKHPAPVPSSSTAISNNVNVNHHYRNSKIDDKFSADPNPNSNYDAHFISNLPPYLQQSPYDYRGSNSIDTPDNNFIYSQQVQIPINNTYLTINQSTADCGLDIYELPDPPLSVSEIGPIPPPPMFSTCSPVLGNKQSSDVKILISECKFFFF